MASTNIPRQIVPIGNLSVLHGDNWGKFPLVNSLFLRGPVRVVVDHLDNEDLVVTVYRTSKIGKYWAEP